MSVKLLTENPLEFVSLKEATQTGLSLHLSKCHIVGNYCHSSIVVNRWSKQIQICVCID